MPSNREMMAATIGGLWFHSSHPKKQAIRCKSMPRPADMEPLQAYYGTGWMLCKFKKDGQEQAAFNELIGAMSVGGVPAIKKLAWTYLPADQNKDPLGQAGYIGAKWEVAE